MQLRWRFNLVASFFAVNAAPFRCPPTPCDARLGSPLRRERQFAGDSGRPTGVLCVNIRQRLVLLAGASIVMLSACTTPRPSEDQIAVARQSLHACVARWVARLDDGTGAPSGIALAASERCTREQTAYARLLIQGHSDGYAVGPTHVAEQLASDYAMRAVIERRASSARNERTP